jgi:hypothetical protein
MKGIDLVKLQCKNKGIHIGAIVYQAQLHVFQWHFISFCCITNHQKIPKLSSVDMHVLGLSKLSGCFRLDPEGILLQAVGPTGLSLLFTGVGRGFCSCGFFPLG